ncbi:MAG: hypothetical protein Q8N03_04410 [Ignavibacteria bacterium]|nr:hypothetical protein [Ignavibacteria bacterium]
MSLYQQIFVKDMIKENGKEYKLCLLDTCIISRIVASNNSERQKFFEIILNRNSPSHPCVAIWTIFELRSKQILYEKFVEFFSIIPLFILKTPDHILLDEYENYPFYKNIDPILFAFSFLKPEKDSLKNVLTKLFCLPEIIQAEKDWKCKLKQDSLNSILSLKSNFVSSNKHFNTSDAEKFYNDAFLQYITSQNPQWVISRMKKGESIDCDAFPSVKSALYTVFYRFYVADRQPETQDIFDILIYNSVPYVDIVISENFQADILGKLKKNDKQFSHIEIFTVKDLL